MSKKLHILLTNKKRGWSGESAMIAELAKGLTAKGHRVSLATNGKANIIERLKDTPTEIFELCLLKEKPALLWTLPRDIRKIIHYIREHKVDIIHSHASFDTWNSAFAVAFGKLKVPLVRTKHNVKDIGKTFVNRWLYGKAIDKLIAPSQAVEDNIFALPFVDRLKVSRIPCGIPIDESKIYAHGKSEARKQLALNEDDQIIAYISRLTRRKDPQTLVKAFLILAKKFPKLKLLIVGGGDDELAEELKQLAQGNDAVELWGHRDDVPAIYAAIDIFVLPALTEAFGLAPLEAMFHGAATIVSDAEGFKEFLENEKNGLIVAKGNVDLLAQAIERTLSDNHLRESMAENGRKTVLDYFNAERMVNETEQLYYEILGETR